MVQKLILNYLILLEDHINVEHVNQIFNFQLDLIYNIEQNKLNKINNQIQNKSKLIKKKINLNYLLNKYNQERNKLLIEKNKKNKIIYKK